MYYSTPKRISIDTIDTHKEINRILRDVPFQKETKTLVDIKNKLKIFKENYTTRLRPRNGKFIYKI